MHHLYLPIHSNIPALQSERGELLAWCSSNGINDFVWIEDKLTSGRISPKDIENLLSDISENDTVVCAQLSRLGRSLSMLSKVMDILHSRNVTVITLDGGRMTPGYEFAAFADNLAQIVAIDRQIKNFRSGDVINLKREEGLALGRPFGAKSRPEKNVLYGKYEKLETLHLQGLSPQKIADELGVSRGTVANYLKKQFSGGK